MSEFLSTNIPKFTSVFTAIGAFFLVLAILFAIAGRANGKKARPLALVILLGPALVLLLAGLVIPGIRTILFSFMNQDPQNSVDHNYFNVWIFKHPLVITQTNKFI